MNTHTKKTPTPKGWSFTAIPYMKAQDLGGNPVCARLILKPERSSKKVALDQVYFGEGISILNDKLYQLTWQGNMGFQYKPDQLKMERSFAYQNSKEGWGLCNDGQRLYKSDGTHQIWVLDPQTQKEMDKIQVMTDKNALKKINELEWVNGKIYANTYQFKKEVHHH